MAPDRHSRLGERIKVFHGIVRVAVGGERRRAAVLILRQQGKCRVKHVFERGQTNVAPIETEYLDNLDRGSVFRLEGARANATDHHSASVSLQK